MKVLMIVCDNDKSKWKYNNNNGSIINSSTNFYGPFVVTVKRRPPTSFTPLNLTW